MRRSAPICGDCEYDLREGDDTDAFVSFSSDMGGGDRADLHAECPECGNLLEFEVSIIVNYSRPVDA